MKPKNGRRLSQAIVLKECVSARECLFCLQFFSFLLLVMTVADH
jgi:hypothetical protein